MLYNLITVFICKEDIGVAIESKITCESMIWPRGTCFIIPSPESLEDLISRYIKINKDICMYQLNNSKERNIEQERYISPKTLKHFIKEKIIIKYKQYVTQV